MMQSSTFMAWALGLFFGGMIIHSLRLFVARKLGWKAKDDDLVDKWILGLTTIPGFVGFVAVYVVWGPIYAGRSWLSEAVTFYVLPSSIGLALCAPLVGRLLAPDSDAKRAYSLYVLMAVTIGIVVGLTGAVAMLLDQIFEPWSPPVD